MSCEKQGERSVIVDNPVMHLTKQGLVVLVES
jgi:hypothetical protein